VYGVYYKPSRKSDLQLVVVANDLQQARFSAIIPFMSHVHDIATRLAQCGCRMTPQRMMILEAIEGAKGHISAEEIYEDICKRYPSLNISTVYRTLELLKELGIVTETRMGDGRVRFHGAGHEHHHHLVCSKCGAVCDLSGDALSPLAETLSSKYGFKADLHHLAIFGCCKKCA
jgi:Fur family ferric uptake transcriptional regulator